MCYPCLIHHTHRWWSHHRAAFLSDRNHSADSRWSPHQLPHWHCTQLDDSLLFPPLDQQREPPCILHPGAAERAERVVCLYLCCEMSKLRLSSAHVKEQGFIFPLLFSFFFFSPKNDTQPVSHTSSCTRVPHTQSYTQPYSVLCFSRYRSCSYWHIHLECVCRS